MKKLLLVAAVVLVHSTMSYATPILCAGSTLAQVIANGTHDCVLNDLLLTFDTPTSVTQNPPYASNPTSYAYFATSGAQPAITTGSDVNIISTNLDSLTFQTADWVTRGTQARTIDIVYTVQLIGSGTITGLGSSLPISGTGSVSAKCTSGCTTVPPGGDFTNTATVPLKPGTPGPITIENLVHIGSGSGHISTLTNTFQVDLVPEPASIAFGAVGFLLLAGLKRRCSQNRG